MKSALYLVYVLNCFFLILTVLLQAGRGGGMALMGSAGGGSSATMFGNRGATTFIQKMTIWSAVWFMSLSILLAFTSMAPSSADRGVIISDEEREAHMTGMGDDDAAAEVVPVEEGEEEVPAPEADEPEADEPAEELEAPAEEAAPAEGTPVEEAPAADAEENENE